MTHKWYRWYRVAYVGAGDPDRESIMFVRAFDLDHARRVFADTIDRYALIDDEDVNGAILNVREGSIWPRTRRRITGLKQ